MIFTEAIKLKDGFLHNLEYHQTRVNQTTTHFYGDANINLMLLQDTIPDNARKGLFKCRVVYSNKIHNIEYVPYIFKKIRNVGIVADNTIDYSHKFANRDQLNTLLTDSGFDDIIIIKNGLVTDASASNLIFISDEALVTPIDFLLPGTKRQYLLDKGIIKEKRISLEDIHNYHRIAFINAMIDIEDSISISVNELQ